MLDTGLAETAEEVSSIAFGFMASKALFAGLHIDVFTLLADGPKSSAEIAGKSGIPMNRVTTLMTALTSIGLVDRDEEGEIYSNSPGAEAFLAKVSVILSLKHWLFVQPKGVPLQVFCPSIQELQAHRLACGL